MEFGDDLVDEVARLTDKFSFAYMKEAFLSTLLVLAAKRDGGDNEWAKEFKEVLKNQIKLLKDQIEE